MYWPPTQRCCLPIAHPSGPSTNCLPTLIWERVAQCISLSLAQLFTMLENIKNHFTRYLYSKKRVTQWADEIKPWRNNWGSCHSPSFPLSKDPAKALIPDPQAFKTRIWQKRTESWKNELNRVPNCSLDAPQHPWALFWGKTHFFCQRMK